MNFNIFNKIDIKTLTILVLVGFLIFTRACQNSETTTGETINIGGTSYEVLSNKTDTQLIPVPVVKWKPGSVIYQERIVYLPTPDSIDTSSIIKQYFSRKVYSDTLNLNDSIGYVIVNDTLEKNELVGRLWDARVNKIKINETTIVKQLPKNQVYVGLTTGFDKIKVINYVGPTILLKTKTDKLYSVGFGYTGNNNMSLQGSLYWKIKLK
jgi:hypothetical protein